MITRHSFTAEVLAYFQARPYVWIHARTLQGIGGSFAWRTRVSQARKRLRAAGAGDIENTVERRGRDRVVDSWYRYVPAEPTATAGHNVNQPSAGRLI